MCSGPTIPDSGIDTKIYEPNTIDELVLLSGWEDVNVYGNDKLTRISMTTSATLGKFSARLWGVAMIIELYIHREHAGLNDVENERI